MKKEFPESAFAIGIGGSTFIYIVGPAMILNYFGIEFRDGILISLLAQYIMGLIKDRRNQLDLAKLINTSIDRLVEHSDGILTNAKNLNKLIDIVRRIQDEISQAEKG